MFMRVPMDFGKSSMRGFEGGENTRRPHVAPAILSERVKEKRTKVGGRRVRGPKFREALRDTRYEDKKLVSGKKRRKRYSVPAILCS